MRADVAFELLSANEEMAKEASANVKASRGAGRGAGPRNEVRITSMDQLRDLIAATQANARAGKKLKPEQISEMNAAIGSKAKEAKS